jgi:hypothetical protein
MAQQVPALSHEQMLCFQEVAGLGVFMTASCSETVGSGFDFTGVGARGGVLLMFGDRCLMVESNWRNNGGILGFQTREGRRFVEEVTKDLDNRPEQGFDSIWLEQARLDNDNSKRNNIKPQVPQLNEVGVHGQ